MNLDTAPRIKLAHLPTPIEAMPRVSKAAGGPQFFVKRDDCTGLAFGGNKVRKIEFLLGEALEQGATTIVTMGTVQSNHLPLTAAAACRLGLKCELVLEHRVAIETRRYHESGNVMLNELYGAGSRVVPESEDAMAVTEAIAREARRRGETPYVIPRGGSTPTGALGYVACAAEIIEQSEREGYCFDFIVHATGSAATQAGLLVGLRLMGNKMPVIGIGVNAPEPVQSKRVYDMACRTAELLGKPGTVTADDIITQCDYVGDGYGLVTPAMRAALMDVARLEGLLLDPVYSGKAMAGMLDLARNGYFPADANVLFIHTGGSPALFAYRDTLHDDAQSARQ